MAGLVFSIHDICYMRYLLILFLGIMAGCEANKKDIKSPVPNTWDQHLVRADESSVKMMMWQGDPLINQYMKNYVVPNVKEQYGIVLELINGQGNQIVTTLMSEMEAHKKHSEIDLIWINGETFYQLRQLDALYGPFVNDLPNAEYIDFENPFIGIDFQQPVDGFECPWGNVQLALIYDTTKLINPPKDLEALELFVKEHPGVFTIGDDFTGMTLLKSLLAGLGGNRESLNGPFDEEKYRQLSSELWKTLNRMKPYFWKEGKTFPSSVAQMHQLFANGELWITMSNNDGEVDNKVQQGIFPKSCRAYVLNSGTIQNSHYLGIPVHSKNPSAAMVVVNYLISPEAQFEKMKPLVWGDGTILSEDKLSKEWKERFSSVPGRSNAPNRNEIGHLAIMEPDPEYMLRLYEDFRTYVIELDS